MRSTSRNSNPPPPAGRNLPKIESKRDSQSKKRSNHPQKRDILAISMPVQGKGITGSSGGTFSVNNSP